MEELLQTYSENYKKANELSLDVITNIEIPLYNNLSYLSKHSFITLLHSINKIKHLPTLEKSLIITLVTDALTTVIKHHCFYEIFLGNNIFIIHLLCKNLIEIFTRISYEDLVIASAYISQIEKYCERINKNEELKNCLQIIKGYFENKQKIAPPILPKENIENENTLHKDSNDNLPILIKKTVTKNALQEKNTNQTTINKENKMSYNLVNNNKRKNAFDLLMNSRKLNKKK